MTPALERAATEIALELPASLRYLNVVGACIVAACARHSPEAEAAASHLELAVQEACANIVLHAFSGVDTGSICMRLSLDAAAVTIELTDDGAPFDPDLVPLPCFDEPQIHGYGLFLIRQLVDDVSYQRSDNRNHLRLVKHLGLPKE